MGRGRIKSLDFGAKPDHVMLGLWHGWGYG